MDHPDDTLATVGPRLRGHREARGRTLADVAGETGVSVSTLSRLESGSRRPTLELLLPLARSYGVTIDELVGAPDTGDPRVHVPPFTRHGRTYIPLTRNPGGLRAFKVVIPGDPRPPRLQVHEGYEWLYVLSGRVRLVVGDRDLVLGPGEAAEFDTRTPHFVGAADERPCEVLNLFGPQGERAHLRA